MIEVDGKLSACCVSRKRSNKGLELSPYDAKKSIMSYGDDCTFPFTKMMAPYLRSPVDR